MDEKQLLYAVVHDSSWSRKILDTDLTLEIAKSFLMNWAEKFRSDHSEELGRTESLKEGHPIAPLRILFTTFTAEAGNVYDEFAVLTMDSLPRCICRCKCYAFAVTIQGKCWACHFAKVAPHG